MGPAVQVTGKVKFKSSPSEKQYLHLQFFSLFWSFFFLFFFTFNLSPFLYPIYSVYLLTLVESHEVVLLKNQDKCNKQETGVLNVYFYLPSINSPT